MTPAARAAAAIDILDEVGRGSPTERALTNWARRSRYAGSKDRAAVRDLVFGVVRRWRSSAWLGGGETGRARMLGALRADGDPGAVFTGEGHAPPPLSAEEQAAGAPIETAPLGVRLDVQDWCLAPLREALGGETEAVLALFQARAQVFLRVNLAMTGREAAIARLAREGIETAAHPLSPSALVVMEGARGVMASACYREGLIELQDAASQAVVDHVADAVNGAEVLDFCAGGGGKSLALFALGARRVVAHDAHAARMRDVPERARRAGARVEVAEQVSGHYPLVFCDVPCSGSGAWRRQPDAKWRLTEAGLRELAALQDAILDQARDHVAPGGMLALATCSLLTVENEARAAAFTLRNEGWVCTSQRRISPLEGGDGFFIATFRDEASG